MDDIIVAKATPTMVILATLASALVLGPLAIIVGYLVWRMKLVVTPTSVVVVNLISRAEFPLGEARIVGEHDRSPYVSDAGGKLDTAGRVLYLVDDGGKTARIGLAPVYGSRRDTMAEDLKRAIAGMQAAG